MIPIEKRYEMLRKWAENNLQENSIVLDVGCGEFFGENWKGFDEYVVGVDIFYEWIEKGIPPHIKKGDEEERGKRDVVIADANRLPIREKSVDLVVDYGCSKVMAPTDLSIDWEYPIGHGTEIIKQCLKVLKGRGVYVWLTDLSHQLFELEEELGVKLIGYVPCLKGRAIGFYKSQGSGSSISKRLSNFFSLH